MKHEDLRVGMRVKLVRDYDDAFKRNMREGEVVDFRSSLQSVLVWFKGSRGHEGRSRLDDTGRQKYIERGSSGEDFYFVPHQNIERISVKIII